MGGAHIVLWSHNQFMDPEYESPLKQPAKKWRASGIYVVVEKDAHCQDAVKECPQLCQTKYEAQSVLMDPKKPLGCGLTCLLSLAKARGAEGYRNATHYHQPCSV